MTTSLAAALLCATVLGSLGALVAATGVPDLVVNVDYPNFLSRHDLLWNWTAGASPVRIRLRHSSTCGTTSGTGGACCITVGPTGNLSLALCNPASPAQLFVPQLNGTISAVVGGCLTRAAEAASVLPCRTNSTTASAQLWSLDDGSLATPVSPSATKKTTQQCLAIKTAVPFCDATICPASAASQHVASGTPLVSCDCENGNRGQQFAVVGGTSGVEKLEPLTWGTSAYAGNGLLGVRVAAEAGAPGVLRLLLDNVLLGVGGRRKPSGYYRMVPQSLVPPLQLSMRQRLHDSTILGNITGASGGAVEFSLFVDATINATAESSFGRATAMVLQVTTRGSSFELRWVQDPDFPTAEAEFFEKRVEEGNSTSSTTTVFACVSSGNKGAKDVVEAAATLGLEAVRARHTSWWARYWEHAFVSLPVTRLEGFVQVQLGRFAASERAALHGLDGAFGPTDMFNFWPDDVWDMNEQVCSAVPFLAAARAHSDGD